MRRRRYINFIGYDKKTTKIPISKDDWWFTNALGESHCVCSCSNLTDNFYITDFGLCRIAYCDSHARNRILENMMSGSLQRGLWCEVYKGKLIPHEYYKRFIPLFKKLYPVQAKKLQKKLKEFKVKKWEELNQ